MVTRKSLVDKVFGPGSKSPKAFATLDLQEDRKAKTANPRELPEPKEPEADWRLAMRKKDK
ncbi:hypothetical protein [Sulfitobacter sp. R18_1]|uniref:hypothetical protein n=1 Tax=Sulfitobacter sp. R18_1 TaxID=2821104 RepID=UPI001ADD435B|nr:hypothetical protein [Sulfitobacter sp. R18_1]MBO9428023.1 hypothetical protein [Sulfitobacter sp. R18_1]